MNIQVKDFVGVSLEDTFKLVNSLMENRKPAPCTFDYGLETHGVFPSDIPLKLDYPIQVSQTNKRKSNKSPIVITIKKHTVL